MDENLITAYNRFKSTQLFLEEIENKYRLEYYQEGIFGTIYKGIKWIVRKAIQIVVTIFKSIVKFGMWIINKIKSLFSSSKTNVKLEKETKVSCTEIIGGKIFVAQKYTDSIDDIAKKAAKNIQEISKETQKMAKEQINALKYLEKIRKTDGEENILINNDIMSGHKRNTNVKIALRSLPNGVPVFLDIDSDSGSFPGFDLIDSVELDRPELFDKLMYQSFLTQTNIANSYNSFIKAKVSGMVKDAHKLLKDSEKLMQYNEKVIERYIKLINRKGLDKETVDRSVDKAKYVLATRIQERVKKTLSEDEKNYANLFGFITTLTAMGYKEEDLYEFLTKSTNIIKEITSDEEAKVIIKGKIAYCNLITSRLNLMLELNNQLLNISKLEADAISKDLSNDKTNKKGLANALRAVSNAADKFVKIVGEIDGAPIGIINFTPIGGGVVYFNGNPPMDRLIKNPAFILPLSFGWDCVVYSHGKEFEDELGNRVNMEDWEFFPVIMGGKKIEKVNDAIKVAISLGYKKINLQCCNPYHKDLPNSIKQELKRKGIVVKLSTNNVFLSTRNDINKKSLYAKTTQI